VTGKALDEQVRFIVERWAVIEGLLSPEDVMPQETFLARLTRERANDLIARFVAVIRNGERQHYAERGLKTCENCDLRTNCEMPGMFGCGEDCPAWLADPKRLMQSYGGFLKYVKGRLCRFRSPDGDEEKGRPIEYVPGEAVIVRIEPDGRIETFLFGAGVVVEVLE